MATISFNGASYTVDHAVKGTDYVHGYDANGVLVVSFEGVSDFSAITYDGTYMAAGNCAEEPCNVVRYVNGKLQKADGTELDITDIGGVTSSHNHSAANITSGTLPVARGGTGNTSVDTTPTSGSTKMVTSGGVYTALSGKAASSHNHSASEITSGTLAVARGGTGNTSVDTTPTSGSTKMVTSGGVYAALSGKAASSHNHSAANITSGTLPLARGGTGVTSIDALKTSLGLSKWESLGSCTISVSNLAYNNSKDFVFFANGASFSNIRDMYEIMFRTTGTFTNSALTAILNFYAGYNPNVNSSYMIFGMSYNTPKVTNMAIDTLSPVFVVNDFHPFAFSGGVYQFVHAAGNSKYMQFSVSADGATLSNNFSIRVNSTNSSGSAYNSSFSGTVTMYGRRRQGV